MKAGEKKTPSTPADTGMEDLGPGHDSTNPHCATGAGDRDRTGDPELGKIRAVHERLARYDQCHCGCDRWEHSTSDGHCSACVFDVNPEKRCPEFRTKHRYLSSQEPGPKARWRMSDLINARNRADAELSATALAAAKAASVYVGTLPLSTPESIHAATVELERTVEAFRRAEVAHSAALRAFEDAR